MTNPSENYKTPDGETPKDENVFPGDTDNEVFRLTEDGVYLVNPQKGNTVETSTRICDWLKVEADTVDEEGEQNGEEKEDETKKEGGVCVRFMTSRGTKCKMALSNEDVSQPGTGLIVKLAKYRLIVNTAGYVTKAGITAVNRYIKAVIARGNLPLMKTIPRAGWADETFSSYLFKNGCISINDPCPFIMKEGAPGMEIKSKGTLDEWKEGISRLAVYSTRIRFAVAVSLAAPLVPILQTHNVLFHFFGSSGRGKTTTLKAAWSVWGSKIPTMKATKNALEEMFAACNHIPFVGDELKQLSSEALADLPFTYGEGDGKGRSKEGKELRKKKKWYGLGLTAAEQSLGEIKKEKSKKQSNNLEGALVRFINIPAMAGKCGVFEGYPSELMLEEDGGTYPHVDGEELNNEGIPDALDKAQQEYVGKASEYLSNEAYGTAGKEFIKCVEQDIAEGGLVKFKDEAAKFMKTFKDNTPSKGHSQTRVMNIFSLVALAGELAIGYGVLPWKKGDSIKDAQNIFKVWADSGETPEQQAESAIEFFRGRIEGSEDIRRFNWNGNRFDLEREQHGTKIAGKLIKNEEGSLCTILLNEQFEAIQEDTGIEKERLIREMINRGMLFGANRAKNRYGRRQVNPYISEIDVGNRERYFIFLNRINLYEEKGDETRKKIAEEIRKMLRLNKEGD